MPKQLTMLALAGGLMSVDASAQQITVMVHDYAEAGLRLLEEAQAEAARILKSAGAEVRWVNCTDMSQEAHDRPAPTELILHILPAGSTRRYAGPSGLGFAVRPEPGSFGAYGGVLYDRVERLTSKTIAKSVVLAHAFAHEIGHLLLGDGAHARSGIMKADWGRPELEEASRGILLFSKIERRRIQQNLRQRAEASLRPVFGQYLTAGAL